MTTISN